MLTERQNQIMGAVRNLAALASGLVVAYGVANDTTWQAVVGFAIAALTAFFAWQAHALTFDSVLSVARAGVSAIAAYLAFRGWDGQGQFEQFATSALALAPTLWSVYLHRPRALNTGVGGVGANPAGGGNVLPSIMLGFFLTPLALGLALTIAGCEKYNSALNQVAAGVAATDNALAGLARNNLPAACAIVAVAEGYFVQLKPRLSAENARIGDQARSAAAAICEAPPTNAAESIAALFKA